MRQGALLIDSHVHLNRAEFDEDRQAVLDRARRSGVHGFLNVGYDLPTSRESIALASDHADIRATVGIHPHDAEVLADAEGNLRPEGRSALEELEVLAADDNVAAYGEIGLDFFRDLSPRPAQRKAMQVQLELADRLGLPVVFHVRDAWVETLELIDRYGVPGAGGVLHSFSGGADDVRWAVERGFFLGIGGPITYKNSNLPEMVALAGPDRILLETDAPWLPPVPHRGKRNESGYLQHTRDRVAEVLGMSAADIERITTRNCGRLFGPWPDPTGGES